MGKASLHRFMPSLFFCRPGRTVPPLHDTDRSARWLLLLLIPVVGWIVILIFNCQSGTPGENRFGLIRRSARNLCPMALRHIGLTLLFVVMRKEFWNFSQTPRFGFAHAVATPRHNDIHFAGVLRADNAQTPFSNIFSTNGYGMVATPSPASNARRLSSSDVTVRRGCLSSNCTVSTGRSRAVSATATPLYFTRVTSESGSGSGESGDLARRRKRSSRCRVYGS